MMIGDRYAIVRHMAGETVAYIGIETIASITDIGTFYRNNGWRSIVGPNGWNITIEVIETYRTREDAEAGLKMLTGSTKGLVATTKRVSKMVRRIDTGEEYISQTEAASANDVSVSGMSNHLQGREGYETIRGMKFERITK